MERLGVFGGTFDPPHRGHLYLARSAVEQLGLNKVLWVLTPNPPHKTSRQISPIEDRLAMLELALEGLPDFEVSRIDIDRAPPHYAVDTIRLLQAANAGAELVYLIGADSLRDLPGWNRPDELINLVHEFGVLHRPGVSVNLSALLSILPGLAGKLTWLDAPIQKISSTDLRLNAGNLSSLRPFIPPRVLAYIQEKGLYQSV